MNKGKKGT